MKEAHYNIILCWHDFLIIRFLAIFLKIVGTRVGGMEYKKGGHLILL